MRRLPLFAALTAALPLAAAAILPSASATDVFRVVVDPAPLPRDTPPVAQVAILLDTSNSMDGLIAQAKQQLWKIVHRVASTTRNGQPVRLEVAIFEYGNSGLPAQEGYIRQVQGFTADLDKVSQALFALTTNGGDEYCGQVIHEASIRLPWAKDGGYKAIFIAGNEPFTQGQFPYATACGEARKSGILVNTLHCGSRDDGIAGHWQDGAVQGGGRFFCIDQNAAVPDIRCPQDDRIRDLNKRLNGTYLPVGAGGREGQALQAKADADNASLSGSAFAMRAACKAQAATNANAYDNSSWDLVDAYRKDGAKALDKTKEADLPAALAAVPAAKREGKVKEILQERAAVQKELLALAEERGAFVAKEQARLAGGKADDSFGAAVLGALDAQMKEKGFANPGK